jgi:hypothetical protein
MSDKRLDEGQVQRGEQYEPPRLTPLGNARELLAGAQGSVLDAIDQVTTQQGGG